MTDEQATPVRLNLQEIRTKIFSHKIRAKKIVQFMGVEIELWQPTLEDMTAQFRGSEDENRRAAVVDTLIKYAYVPGTEEHIFQAADEETLKSMPFGKDFTGVMEALQELTDISFTTGRNA